MLILLNHVLLFYLLFIIRIVQDCLTLRFTKLIYYLYLTVLLFNCLIINTIYRINILFAALIYYLHSTYDFDLMLNATEDYQTYGIGRSFNVTENTQVGVNFQRTNLTYDNDNSLMFYYKGTFKWFD